MDEYCETCCMYDDAQDEGEHIERCPDCGRLVDTSPAFYRPEGVGEIEPYDYEALAQRLAQME